MDMTLVNVVLVGIGGYGARYVTALDGFPEARLVAVVDPAAESTEHWSALEARGIRQYQTLGGFLEAGGGGGSGGDLVAHSLSSRAVLPCLAGWNERALRKADQRHCSGGSAHDRSPDAAGRFLEIGYQWSFSRAIRRLKADILAGIFAHHGFSRPASPGLGKRLLWAQQLERTNQER